MKRIIVFDFDGTIVDSRAAYYNSITKHLTPMGISKNKIESVIDLGLNLGETLRKFIPSRLYRWWIKREIMKDVLDEAAKVRKCRDASQIGEISVKKILVSNSLSEFVIPVLNQFKMRKVFREIYCAEDFNDKAQFIRMYLKIHGIRPYECFYVGDRVADVTIAKEIGCKSIIVSGRCSWNSKNDLMKAGPDFIVPGLGDVKRIVERSKL